MPYTAEHLENSRAEGFGPLPVLRAALAAMLELNGEPVRLLDCGCGTGFFTRQYARLPGVAAAGLDMDETLLSAARELAEKEGLSVEFVQGDITKLPYPDNSFDVVASDILLEIFPDKTVPVKELVRVCRPGGRELCMEPNYLSAVHYDPRLEDEDNRMWIWYSQAGRAFGAGVELPDAMRRSGLEGLQIVPWLWGGLKDPLDMPEEVYLRERDAELEKGIQLGLVPGGDAEQYRALFRRTAAAWKKGNAAVLHGINVYLVCGRKCAL